MSIAGSVEYDIQDSKKYNDLRWWLGLTWGDVLDKATDLYPRKTAVVDDAGQLSYRELRRQVDRLAVGLANLGIEERDRVLIQVPNWKEYVVAFFALQKIGAIPVLLLPRHTELEIDHFTKLTEPTAWILPLQYRRMDYRPIISTILRANPCLKHVITVRTDEDSPYPGMEDLIEQVNPTPADLGLLAARRPDPMEVAQIMPTGGTTGLPKAAPRTHNSFLCNVEYHSRAWEITSEDTILTIAPVSHGQGMLCGMGGAIFNFATFVLIDSTDPKDILRVVETEKVTAIPTVPALINRLVHFDRLEDYDTRSLRKIYAGGAPSTPELIRSVSEKMGCRFVSAFGSVEGTNAMTRLDDDVELLYTSVGRACCPYDTCKIIDRDENELPPLSEGELVSKGPGVFTGYFKSADEQGRMFTRDGFLKTGDLASIDEEGNIRITGRIKDIILRGGENISAREIENLISFHPDVQDVAVIGMPDQEMGERICAYIQKTRNDVEMTLEGLVAFLKEKGASVLNFPERVEFIETMPLTKVGKADKRYLREDIRRRLEGSADDM